MHMQDGWIVKVEDVPYAWQKRVWLLQVSKDGVIHNATVGKDGFLVMKLYKESEPLPTPLFVIPGMAWKPFVDAVTEALPPIEKEVVDAELKATRFHLEDMRKLAGLVGENIVPHMHGADCDCGLTAVTTLEDRPLLCSNCGCRKCKCKND